MIALAQPDAGGRMKVKLVVLFILALPALAVAADKATKAADKPLKLIRNDTWACIPAAQPQGMDWESGRWVPHQYQEPEKFTLNVAILDDDGAKFIHMTIKNGNGDNHCGGPWNYGVDGLDTCSQFGETMVFSKSKGTGAISYMGGAIDTSDKRDSVTVMPFTCQSF